MAHLAEEVQQVTGETVQMALVDQGDTGPEAAQATAEQGIERVGVKLPQAKRGFGLLPKRWGGTLVCVGGAIPASRPRR